MINIKELRLLAQDFKLAGSPMLLQTTQMGELLDRLEEAEKEREMDEGRIADLMADLNRVGHENDKLRTNLETERMRLAACGVVALANTTDSAAKARDMRPEYWSASCEDVARIVDQNIELRAKIARMEQQAPVGKFIRHPSNGLWEQDGYGDNPDANPLYALPGAQSQPTASVPGGWLRAIDEALVVAHVGVANESDTYEQAKAKLDSLIGFHVDVATDPAVNGGWKLAPIVSTDEMDRAGADHTDGYLSTAQMVWDAMLATAPKKVEQ